MKKIRRISPEDYTKELRAKTDLSVWNLEPEDQRILRIEDIHKQSAMNEIEINKGNLGERAWLALINLLKLREA